MRDEIEEKERQDFIQGLRNFAFWLEANPEIDAGYYGMYHSHYLDTKEKLLQYARIMAPGNFSKNWTDSSVAITKDFGGRVKFEAYTRRDQICERVKTGTKIIPARPAVPEKEEETFEWRCPDSAELSLLKPESQE